MEDLESYEPTGSEIVDVDPVWLTVAVAGEMPTAGEALAIDVPDGDPVYVVAGERLGGRKLRAFRLDRRDLETGFPVATTERRAGVRRPADGRLSVDETSIEPEPDDASDDWIPLDRQPPPFESVRADFAPVETGYEGLDCVAPVVHGGTTLVIDNSGDRRSFDNVVGATATDRSDAAVLRAPVEPSESDSGDPDVLVESGRRAPDRVAAIRLAVALAANRRDRGTPLVVAIELPAVSRTPGSAEEAATSAGYSELVDHIAATLASTDDAAATVLLRLPVGRAPDGLDQIVETLDLGDVDAQIFVDEEGRFVPNRSSSAADRADDDRSRADAALATIRRAEEARDKAKLLGRNELTEAERDALDRADTLRTDLTPELD